MNACDHPRKHDGPMRSADGTGNLDQPWTCEACGLMFNPQVEHDSEMRRCARESAPRCVDCGRQNGTIDQQLALPWDDQVLYERHGPAPLCGSCAEKRKGQPA